MSANEMLVIVGGLFFGYLIVTVLMNPKSNKTSDKSHPHESSHSSQQKSDKENSSDEQNTYQKSYAKEEYAPSNWFLILEVTESASMSEISAQYKRKIREYHPDKVAALGRELRELAEFKSKEINSAYTFAKKLKS
jgi:DnaJ like chaperone protein